MTTPVRLFQTLALILLTGAGASCGGGGESGSGSTGGAGPGVDGSPPSNLVYVPSTISLAVGEQLSSVVPAVNGAVTTWSVTPALPKGLTMSAGGALSGSPRESQAATNHTITAANTSGQTTFMLNLAVTTTMPVPVPASYTTFGGATVLLHAWEGRNVVVLTRNPSLNPGLMQLWLEALDKGWDFFRLATGRTPALGRQYNGKATLADVPDTCGAGCGFLGATGIEAQNVYFDREYSSALNNGAFGGFLFYEMGRNFWFYSSEAGYRPPTSDAPIVTGYAVLMSWWAMEAANVRLDVDVCLQLAHVQNFAHHSGLIDTYLGDPSLNWENTLGQNRGVQPAGCAIDAPVLFSSFMLRTRRDYGGPDFHLRLWQEVDARPNATTTQLAVDNLVLAASAAAAKNLTGIFDLSWRWPVSDAAKAEALMKWGAPVSN